MFRYLLLAWDASNIHETQEAGIVAGRLRMRAEWKCVVDAPGLCAFHSGTRPGSSETLVLKRNGGAIFGKVFHRWPEAAPEGGVAAFGPAETHDIEATRGQWLIERCWGRYVAVIHDASDGSVHVLRDPTGGLPCYFLRHQGVGIFFSDVEDCFGLGVGPFSINWRYIAAFVPYSALQVRATGLNEVTEVQAGERISLRRSSISRSFAWNPVRIAGGEALRDREAAVSALQATTRSCVGAWTSAYGGLVHNLSGGLDSSIVLSCLVRAPGHPETTCLHYFAPESRDEDERKYARLAARHFGVALMEYALEPKHLSLEPLVGIRRSAKPWFYIHELERGAVENRIADERGATAIISGAGGDALFYQARADLAVADYACRRGVRPALLRVALDAACIERRSIWPMLGAAVRQRLRRKRWNPLAEALGHRALIDSQATELAWSNEELLHPWLEGAEGIVPGKVWQIISLSLAASFYDAFGLQNAPERVAPLMSQPLMELCLRIPTYLSIAGGRDRAIARRAFAADLPPRIVGRRAKGAIDHYNVAVLDGNLPFVREMLLDGLLVRERILNRSQLERHLSGTRSPADFEYNEILHHHLCTEVWLRRWEDARRLRAA